MKFKILDLLRNRNDYVSGEEIGAFLGVSRTAIWKNIIKLKDIGYNIESVSNKGYRLVDDRDIVNEYEINYDNVIFNAEIDSTNNECKRQADKGCKSGLLVTCDNQTAGKGRLGSKLLFKLGNGACSAVACGCNFEVLNISPMFQTGTLCKLLL